MSPNDEPVKIEKIDIIARILGIMFLLSIGYVYFNKDRSIECDSSRAKKEIRDLVVTPLSDSAKFELTLKNISQVLKSKSGDTHCRAVMFLHKEDDIIELPIKYSFYTHSEGGKALSMDIADDATIPQQLAWGLISKKINSNKKN